MKCPFCSFVENRVVDSRLIGDSNSIRRRRECSQCGYRFTTYEHIEEKKLMVIKRDKRREQFNLEKLSLGINKAVEKLPISQTKVEELLHSIEEKAIFKAGDKHEIESSVLGEIVIDELKNFDLVAYIRFASVYKQFKDLEEFINEIKSLLINTNDRQ